MSTSSGDASSMFSGFKSQCTIPFSCMKLTALISCTKMTLACSSLSYITVMTRARPTLFWDVMNSKSSPPLQYSKIMQMRVSVSMTSFIPTTFGCRDNFLSALISCRTLRCSFSSSRRLSMILTATRSRVLSSIPTNDASQHTCESLRLTLPYEPSPRVLVRR